jgi:hypothetical protein
MDIHVTIQAQMRYCGQLNLVWIEDNSDALQAGCFLVQIKEK